MERRIHERLPYEVEVSMDSANNFYAGFVQNISVGGVFVATSALHPLGSEVEFDLSLKPGIEKVRVRGVVKWHRDLHEETHQVSSGMGVEFLELDEAIRQRINQFMGHLRDTLFYDDEP